MSSHDPFGRPPGGNPFGRPPGGPLPYQPGRQRRHRRFSGFGIAAFLMFDVIVVLALGVFFFSGAFGDDDTGAVIIPPAAGQVDDDDRGSSAAWADGSTEEDDDDDVHTTVVTRESGTSTIVTPSDDTPAAAKPSGPAPSGINASSMIRERNLRPAVADLKRLAPGKVLMLSIHPTHVSATVKAPNGDLKIVSDHWDQPAQLANTVKGAAAHRQDGVSWSTINPAAPERLVKASGAKDAQVSHLVVMPAFTPWALHLKSGKRIPGDANGKPIS